MQHVYQTGLDSDRRAAAPNLVKLEVRPLKNARKKKTTEEPLD